LKHKKRVEVQFHVFLTLLLYWWVAKCTIEPHFYVCHHFVRKVREKWLL